MKTAATIFGLTAFALAATAGSPVNLLQNASFEEPGNPLLGEGAFANWETFGNVSQAEESMVDPFAPAPLDGNFSALMFGGFFGPGVQSDSGAFQIVDVPNAGGKAFRATVSVQSLSTDPLAPLDFGDPDMNGSFGHLPLLLMQFRDANGDQLSQPEATVFSADVDPFDQWLTVSLDGLAPAGTEEINVFCLFIQFGDDEGSLFWDSASLIEVEDGGPVCDPGEDDPNKDVADSTAPYEGFMNVLELDGETLAFGSAWGIPDLQASFDDGVPSVTMAPAEVDDPDPYWYIGGGMPGAMGNKIMDANLFQSTQGCLAGQTVTFSGYVHENSLVPGYEASIFIRDFAANFSTFEETVIPAVPGEFTLSLDTIDDPTRVVQWGYTLNGPNVWPGDAAALGTVTYSSVPAMGGPCNAADLAEPFDVLDLGDIGAFVTGFTGQQPIADIAAPFGVWDLGDIGLFVTEFTGGCP